MLVARTYDPYLISSSLLAVLVQRLVRKGVRRVWRYTASRTARASVFGTIWHCQGGSLLHGRGCANCRETGYRGRIGLFELLMIDDKIRSKVQDRANASEIRDSALNRGMRLLSEDGVLKINRGLTTVDEVSRVTARAAM
jgi:type II secretory ATPase GspE/PulE/Tfp pilus assembly ATPase PilB-like protein